jgi:hypothetical protein
MSFMPTEDSTNVVRAYVGRVYEQVNGRDPFTTFSPKSRRLTREIYDANGESIFEAEIITLAATVAINQLAFDPDLHQPFVDEFAVGFPKQFPGQINPLRDVRPAGRLAAEGVGCRLS